MKLNIPFSLLSRTDLHNELYVWAQIRRIGRVFYNFTYADLSKLTGISHTTLRKRIKAIISLGWASITENGTLALNGINKLKNSYTTSGLQRTSVCIPTRIAKTKKEQILIFRSILVNHNLIRQERRVAKLNKIVQNAEREHGKLSKKQLTILKQAGSIEKLAGSIDQKTSLSNRGIGAIMQRSASTGKRIQRELRNKGFIKTVRRFKEIAANVTRLEYLYNYMPSGVGLLYSAKDKSVIKRMPNEIQYIF